MPNRYEPLYQKIIRLFLLIIFSVYSLFPILWIVLTSLRSNNDFYKYGSLALPKVIFWENYPTAWKAARFSIYYLNSIWIAIVTVGGLLLLCVLISYSLTYIQFHGKRVINLLILFGLMIPFDFIMIPLFHNAKNFNIINTHWSVILPQIGLWLPFSVYLMKGFMKSLPVSLVESARVDGAGDYRTLFSIIVPLVKPAVISLLIFNLISSWNNLMLPTIMIQNDRLKTVPLGLNAFRTKFNMDLTLTATGAVIMAVPIIIFYMFFQRTLISGLIVGAVKE